eukprot:353478-Chlamydomonas_euryale.AAC.2
MVIGNFLGGVQLLQLRTLHECPLRRRDAGPPAATPTPRRLHVRMPGAANGGGGEGGGKLAPTVALVKASPASSPARQPPHRPPPHPPPLPTPGRYGVYRGAPEHGAIVQLLAIGDVLLSLHSGSVLVAWALGQYNTPT